MRYSVKPGNENRFRNVYADCPDVFELCIRYTNSFQNFLGTQSCLSLTVQSSSEILRHKMSFSITSLSNCL